eukprot:1159779-Pelagomonas_calceolata.AAC.1
MNGGVYRAYINRHIKDRVEALLAHQLHHSQQPGRRVPCCTVHTLHTCMHSPESLDVRRVLALESTFNSTLSAGNSSNT